MCSGSSKTDISPKASVASDAGPLTHYQRCLRREGSDVSLASAEGARRERCDDKTSQPPKAEALEPQQVYLQSRLQSSICSSRSRYTFNLQYVLVYHISSLANREFALLNSGAAAHQLAPRCSRKP